MAISKRGSRRIVVDGIAYRWKVPLPDEYQEAGCPGISAAVSRIEPKGAQLWLMFPDRYSMSGPIVELKKPVLPSEIVSGIRAALAAGWQAERPGKQFGFQMIEAEASQ